VDLVYLPPTSGSDFEILDGCADGGGADGGADGGGSDGGADVFCDFIELLGGSDIDGIKLGVDEDDVACVVDVVDVNGSVKLLGDDLGGGG
jgi:hypothetical protein